MITYYKDRKEECQDKNVWSPQQKTKWMTTNQFPNMRYDVTMSVNHFYHRIHPRRNL